MSTTKELIERARNWTAVITRPDDLNEKTSDLLITELAKRLVGSERAIDNCLGAVGDKDSEWSERAKVALQHLRRYKNETDSDWEKP